MKQQNIKGKRKTKLLSGKYITYKGKTNRLTEDFSSAVIENLTEMWGGK